MFTDPVADLLTRIRNAQSASHRSVRVRASKLNRRILEVLKKEGFIDGFSNVLPQKGEKANEKSSAPDAGSYFEVVLRYYESGEPLLGRVTRMSRPGQRHYVGVGELPKIFAGLGICIISTSQGVMSDREARKKGIGGELLAVVG